MVSSYMFVGSDPATWDGHLMLHMGVWEKLEVELENADGKSVGLGRRGNLIIGHVTELVLEK